jgi:hypothetical protein
MAKINAHLVNDELLFHEEALNGELFNAGQIPICMVMDD